MIIPCFLITECVDYVSDSSSLHGEWGDSQTKKEKKEKEEDGGCLVVAWMDEWMIGFFCVNVKETVSEVEM